MEYELITRLGMRLREVPDRLGWDGLLVFLRYLPEESPFKRELTYGPEMARELAAFASPAKLALMLAELYDNVSALRYEYACSMSKKGTRIDKPQRYPTPWGDPDGESEETHIGKGAIPVSEFEKWYYQEA